MQGALIGWDPAQLTPEPRPRQDLIPDGAGNFAQRNLPVGKYLRPAPLQKLRKFGIAEGRPGLFSTGDFGQAESPT
jgi:hypothetical protein